jgi:hypothetical protein
MLKRAAEEETITKGTHSLIMGEEDDGQSCQMLQDLVLTRVELLR